MRLIGDEDGQFAHSENFNGGFSGVVGSVKEGVYTPSQTVKEVQSMFSVLPDKSFIAEIPVLGSVLQAAKDLTAKNDTSDIPNFHDMGVQPVTSTRTYWWVLAIIITLACGLTWLKDKKYF